MRAQVRQCWATTMCILVALLLVYACVSHPVRLASALVCRRAIAELGMLGAHILESVLQLLVLFLQSQHPISENTIVIQAIIVCEMHVQSMLSVTIPAKVSL